MTTPTTNSTEQEEGWVEWKGGSCPINPTREVEAKFRDYDTSQAISAYRLDWRHLGGYDDIVAYRIVEAP